MSTPITLIGNLTADPELKFFEGGTAKATAGLAVNESWTDKDGERQEKTSYFNLVAWRNTAEDLCRIADKGMRVIVVCKPEQRSWEDKDGNKRSVVEFVVSEFGPASRGLEEVIRKKSQASQDGGAKRPAATGAKRPATSRNDIPEDEEPF